MGKGRNSNPSIEHIGNWYKHSSCQDYMKVGLRNEATSTGLMLDVKRPDRQIIPPAPPHAFTAQAVETYSEANPFSHHDNRNSIQLMGEYLGDGQQTRLMGRRLTDIDFNQHRTQVSDFLRHHSREMTDSFFHSNYMLSHDGKQGPASGNRRFTRRYKTPPNGQVELSTTTTDQFTVESGKLPYKTSTQTLVSSGEPYLKKNQWKYAYNNHGKYDIYPKVWGDRCAARINSYTARPLPVISNRITRQCNSDQVIKLVQ